MKVKDTNEIRPVDTNRTPESRRTQGGTPPPADTISTGAKDRLDAAVQAARQGMASDRTVRLEAIEAAIRQGTFKPDPGRIAGKMLDDAEVTAAVRSMLKR